ncbi:MAG TPA: metal-dependent transcriptional regulator [candidate division Zixibacteria bacterium]|nr:metal-dependent transcriptional regulator [candidate division Zixibacteria bacterium]
MNYISPNLEDYLEIIDRLISNGKPATVSAIARMMGISRPSVTQMVAKMIEFELVEHVPYGDVRLTETGREIARKVAERHRLLAQFLRDILGVPPETADMEACELEHSIGADTTARLAAFVQFVGASDSPPEWLERFWKYLETSEMPEFCKECKRLREMENTDG